MKSVIPGANVKIFGRAIHSLSKIGDELYIEPLEEGLSLRTVNSSRSAFACFVFSPSFFLRYDGGSKKDRPRTSCDDDDDETIKCKIGMKSCLNVFKSLSTLEKSVEKCKVHINMQDAKVIFQLYCHHSIVKTYNLAFIESETLQAVFSKEHTPNILTAQSRLLCDLVSNFQTNQAEVSLIVNGDEVVLKNYMDDEHDKNKVIHTQMNLSPEEFQLFQIGVNTEVTFCLKELRAVLNFSEAANMPLSIYFETPGKPIIFCLDSDPTFDANFVLATLADFNSQVSCSQQSTQQTRSAQQNDAPEINRKNAAKKRQMSDNNEKSLSKRHQSESYISEYCSMSKEKENTFRSENTVQGETCTMHNDREATDATKHEDARNGITLDNELCSDITNPGVSSEEAESPLIPVLSKQDSHIHQSDTWETKEDEEVPGTPPRSSQFKSLFFGLSQASITASQKTENQAKEEPVVLAEDSDAES